MRIHPLIRMIAAGAAIWATGWIILLEPFRRRAGPHAAIAPDDPAADPEQGPIAVRGAGPQNMRDGDRLEWDHVDEASDGSFPASDPPSR